MSIKNVIEAAGGQRELASALGCSRQLVNYWATGTQQPGYKWVLEMERLFPNTTSRYLLRPDIYGPAPRKARQ